MSSSAYRRSERSDFFISDTYESTRGTGGGGCGCSICYTTRGCCCRNTTRGCCYSNTTRGVGTCSGNITTTSGKTGPGICTGRTEEIQNSGSRLGKDGNSSNITCSCENCVLHGDTKRHRSEKQIRP